MNPNADFLDKGCIYGGLNSNKLVGFISVIASNALYARGSFGGN
jgi:hypothetical protein